MRSVAPKCTAGMPISGTWTYPLSELVKRWRKARLRVERGDPRALAAFRNTCLGLPAASGAADVDKLFEGSGSWPSSWR